MQVTDYLKQYKTILSQIAISKCLLKGKNGLPAKNMN